MTIQDPLRARLLLLLPTTSYRADAYVDAAKQLGLDLTVASEAPSAFADRHPAELLTLDLGNPSAAVEAARDFAAEYPVSFVVGPDDDTAVVAALISEELGLPSNPAEAVRAARSKARQREILRDHGVPGPEFCVLPVDDDPGAVARAVAYPCVLKPVALSASRGVIRADDAKSFVAAHTRLTAILDSAGVAGASRRVLVERYVPGPEFALEGIIMNGGLHVLALFDKPDPLEGPFFEETIYVTPSRLERSAQGALVDCAGRAAAALGLRQGPVHVELRYNDEGAWLIELAARPIGGKCGRVLRFGNRSEYSLETVILGLTTGQFPAVPSREANAAAVMMIPTPRAGVLEQVGGVDAARAVLGVEDVLITAHRGQELVPLPEGSRYLGFIFARGDEPAFVEQAVREAHGELDIRIAER